MVRDDSIPSGFPGEHFPPGSALARAVTVWVSHAGLHVAAADGGTAVWPFAELRLMRGDRAGEPVQIERAVSPVEVVVVPDRALLAQLAAHRPAGAKLVVAGGRTTGVTLLVALLVVIGAGVALYRFGVPALADMAADRVPVAWERELGDAVVNDFAPEAAREREARIVAPAARLHERLAAAAAGPAAGSRLVVARQELVNAFAAQGGTVVVTTGLLRALRTSDELAAVIAHELGHVRRRHPMHGMMRQLSLQAVLGVLAGDASLWSGGLRVAGQLGGLRYSRELEAEADDDALRLLAQEGIEPAALSRALESLMKSSPGSEALPGFLSTHPAPRERIERVARESATLRPAEHAVHAVSAADWDAMKLALTASRPAGVR